VKRLVLVVFVLSFLMSVAFVTVPVAGQSGGSLSAQASAEIPKSGGALKSNPKPKPLLLPNCNNPFFSHMPQLNR